MFSFKNVVSLMWWWLGIIVGVLRVREYEWWVEFGVWSGGSIRRLLTFFCSDASSAALTRSRFCNIITSYMAHRTSNSQTEHQTVKHM